MGVRSESRSILCCLSSSAAVFARVHSECSQIFGGTIFVDLHETSIALRFNFQVGGSCHVSRRFLQQHICCNCVEEILSETSVERLRARWCNRLALGIILALRSTRPSCWATCLSFVTRTTTLREPTLVFVGATFSGGSCVDALAGNGNNLILDGRIAESGTASMTSDENNIYTAASESGTM